MVWTSFTLKYPKKVRMADITVRDGFQHEEKFISTDAKVITRKS
jgi:hydroxymethylglutaryl-CoA lyase